MWPAQAAIHAGMKYVVNAVPDNWPMALHLAEEVSTLYRPDQHIWDTGPERNAGDKVLLPMPGDSIRYTGHYIDHELVAAIEEDCKRRIDRRKTGAPMRFLLTIGELERRRRYLPLS